MADFKYTFDYRYYNGTGSILDKYRRQSLNVIGDKLSLNMNMVPCHWQNCYHWDLLQPKLKQCSTDIPLRQDFPDKHNCRREERLPKPRWTRINSFLRLSSVWVATLLAVVEVVDRLQLSSGSTFEKAKSEIKWPLPTSLSHIRRGCFPFATYNFKEMLHAASLFATCISLRLGCRYVYCILTRGGVRLILPRVGLNGDYSQHIFC